MLELKTFGVCFNIERKSFTNQMRFFLYKFADSTFHKFCNFDFEILSTKFLQKS